MSLRQLTVEELQNLVPAIQERWREEHYAVLLVLCMKDHAKQGKNPTLTLVTACYLTREWVTNYLKNNHAAVASPDDYKPIVLSFLGEVMALSEILP